MSNSTNLTVSQVTFGERVSIGLLFSVISSLAIFLHLFALYSAFQTKDARKSTFHILLANLTVADCILFSLYLFYAAPCAFANGEILGHKFNEMIGHLQEWAYFPTTYTTLVMALNRACALGNIDLPRLMKKTSSLYLTLATIWILSIIVTTLNMYLYSCWTTFDASRNFIFRQTCVDPQMAPVSPSILIDEIIIYGVAIPYLYCFRIIWRQRRQVGSVEIQDMISARQTSLCYQAALIWIPTVVNPIAFLLIPIVSTGFWAGFASGLLVLLRFFVTPITILAFSKETRQNALKIIHNFLRRV